VRLSQSLFQAPLPSLQGLDLSKLRHEARRKATKASHYLVSAIIPASAALRLYNILYIILFMYI
jgi:hypothetical protein